jgi:hypothetical protein
MLRKMHRKMKSGKLPLFAFMLAVLPAAAQNHPARRPAQPPNTPQPIPSERLADSYAIYSLLMPGSPSDTISPRQIHHWVIANTTVSIHDMNPAVPPDGQLKAPPDNIRAFNDAVNDFEARRYQRFLLDAGSFHPKHAFSLLNEQQVNALRRSGGSVSSGIVFFSAVYFNGTQTSALVYVNEWCANLCAAGQWVYLEKQNGQWVRRSGLIS